MNNNNTISKITDSQTMTSMQIAEITGKRHRDVLKAIRTMEPAWEKEQGRKFSLLLRQTATGLGGHKMNPYYELNRKECLYIATKFNDQARARLVIRWAELEEERMQGFQSQTPDVSPQTSTTLPVDPRNMTRLQILQLALAAEEESERLRLEKKELEDEKVVMQDNIRSLEADNYGLMVESGQKDQQIKHLEERTAYLNIIMADSSTVTVTQIAQDYGMAAKAFNELLRGLHVQRKVGDQWILYGEHLNRGYVATRMIPIHHANQPDTYRPLTAWTQTGRRFLYDHLKKHGVLPIIERQQQA